jgi:hypothetical protein
MSSNEVPLRIGGNAGVGGVVIWGDETKASLLFTSVENESVSGSYEVTVTRPAGVVKRYPGDPRPFTRRGTTYTYSLWIGRSNQTTPGDPFWIEVPAEPLPGQVRKVYQFTTNENNTQLKSAFDRVCSTAFNLRFNSGKVVLVTP